jgi:hypothetical protein
LTCLLFFLCFFNFRRICLSFIWHLFLLQFKIHKQKQYSLHCPTYLFNTRSHSSFFFFFLSSFFLSFNLIQANFFGGL